MNMITVIQVICTMFFIYTQIMFHHNVFTLKHLINAYTVRNCMTIEHSSALQKKKRSLNLVLLGGEKKQKTFCQTIHITYTSTARMQF